MVPDQPPSERDPLPAHPESVAGRPGAARLLAQRLMAGVALAAALMGLPLLMPWLHGAPLLGWPRWAVVLFALWAVGIGALALTMESSPSDEPGPP